MDALSAPEIRGIRMRAQLLDPSSRASSAEEVVRSLCGLQAQDLRAARMGVWARTSGGLLDSDVELARTRDRSIVRTWAMRNTLHLLAAEDVAWIRALLLPRFVAGTASGSRRLGLDEATYTRAMGAIERCFVDGRALTRQALAVELAAEGIDASGQRLPYLIARASMENLICEGSFASGKPTYVLASEWLGPAAGRVLEPQEALGRLATRYLTAYWPAGPQDFAAWSGLPVGWAREVFELAAGFFTKVLRDEEPPRTINDPAPQSGALLLPAFDTFLLGYRDRSLLLDSRYTKRVNAGGGIIKPVVMVGGVIEGTWALRRIKRAGEVHVTPFEPFSERTVEELNVRIEDLGRFLALPLSLKLVA